MQNHLFYLLIKRYEYKNNYILCANRYIILAILIPSPVLRLSQPLSPSLEQQLRRFLTHNPFVQHVSRLVRDLQALTHSQLWFEDLETVLLLYTQEGEHVGYIAAE